MILGHGNLKKAYPEHGDDVKENGIDLRIGGLSRIDQSSHYIGCVDDIKYLPKLVKVEPANGKYKLMAHTYYQATIKPPIRIYDGSCQFYFLRSTLCRCGLILTDAVGDNGYQGTLRVGIYNSAPHTVHIGENERIIQAVTIRNDGTAKKYQGDYQNDKIYNSNQ